MWKKNDRHRYPPMDLGANVNAAANWFGRNPIINGVMTNPVFTALFLTALVSVIMIALYHGALKGTGVKRGARWFLYTFIAMASFTFLHHSLVVRGERAHLERNNLRDVFASIQASGSSGVGALGIPSSASPPGATIGGAIGARPDNVGFQLQDVEVPLAGAPSHAK